MSYDQAESLTVHYSVHSIWKEVVSETCGQGFTLKLSWKFQTEHLKIDTARNDFLCEICGRRLR